MITLVTTVLNDREGTESFFEQMAVQTQTPDEIVIVDGGSKDGTWELLLDESEQDRPWHLIALQDHGCNVARGRNIAIAKATHDIIASTDVGCAWDAEWLEELVGPLVSDLRVEVVMGSWGVKQNDLKGPWAKTEFALKGDLLQTSATPKTYASSRSIAYRKQLWEKLGGYPEDLTLAGDDYVFDMLIEANGSYAASAPAIRCYWHRHETLKGFLKEQYRYFVGNGEAGITGHYFLFVGARLGGEVLGLAAGTSLLLTRSRRPIGMILLVMSLISIGLRFRRWIPAAKRLAAMGVEFPLWRVAIFETLCRVHSLRGYLTGWSRGAKDCRDCRKRLHDAGAV
jgi:glycosyltransferase involved in cell wall biosynthesis